MKQRRNVIFYFSRTTRNLVPKSRSGDDYRDLRPTETPHDRTRDILRVVEGPEVGGPRSLREVNIHGFYGCLQWFTGVSPSERESTLDDEIPVSVDPIVIQGTVGRLKPI